MRETLGNSGGYLTDQIEDLFAIFYVDDGYIASRDAEFLQEALWPRYQHKEDAGDGVHAGEDKGPASNRLVQMSEGRSRCRGRADMRSRVPCVRE